MLWWNPQNTSIPINCCREYRGVQPLEEEFNSTYYPAKDVPFNPLLIFPGNYLTNIPTYSELQRSKYSLLHSLLTKNIGNNHH